MEDKNDDLDKRLFLIDAYAMIFRGYYALIRSPRLTSSGMNTSAVFGFTNSLIELIKRERPTHIAVAFDVGGKTTIRHEVFEEYKANRAATPEAIMIAVPYIKRILKAMGIPVLLAQGYEADDLIGTLSRKAEGEGFEVFMVTPDKDFGQLVTEKVKIYKPGRKGNDLEILGKAEINAKYGIKDPKQVIDFLAMMGDSVDNIPGLEGVGEKTALKFLQDYGTLENLLAHTSDLKGKLKEKVEGSSEKGLLSKKLATIITDAPIDFNEQEFHLDPPDFEELKRVYEELEFRRLYENTYKAFVPEESVAIENTAKKVSPQAEQLSLFSDFDALNEAMSTKRTIETNDHLYQTIDNTKALEVLVGNLLTKEAVCFDTETTSLNVFEARLIGVSLSYKKGLAYYVAIPEDKEEATEFLEILRPFFENEEQIKIAHNLKFDYKILLHNGIDVKGKLFDTMIAHYLLNPDGRHGMDYLSEVYLDYIPVPIEKLIGKKGKDQITLNKIPVAEQTQYSGEDADVTFQLYKLFAPQLIEKELESLFTNIEMPLVKVLARMELAGIALNKDWLLSESKDLESDLNDLEKQIFDFAGEEFNMNSPKQLGEILFEKLKLDPKAKKTRTGQYKTSEDVLTKLAAKSKIIQSILDYRQLQKLKSTYVDALPAQIDPYDERVHTHFSQTTAATGRLASSDPNLQNIPARTARGQQIRGAFVAAEGYKIISADYSQIELRLIAEISGETNMIDAFLHGADIHASTAAQLFKIPIEEVTKQQRSRAKTVNFGIIYGQGAFGLAEQTGLSRNEAREMIDAYYGTYPRLKEYMEQQVRKGRDQGYVETIMGRRRYLTEINSRNHLVRSHAERTAVNAPIQGSAADVIKVAMIQIDGLLEQEKLKSKMLLQVHDELIFETPEEELEKVKAIIKDKMENAYRGTVPLIVEIGVGNNWLEAH